MDLKDMILVMENYKGTERNMLMTLEDYKKLLNCNPRFHTRYLG